MLDLSYVEILAESHSWLALVYLYGLIYMVFTIIGLPFYLLLPRSNRFKNIYITPLLGILVNNCILFLMRLFPDNGRAFFAFNCLLLGFFLLALLILFGKRRQSLSLKREKKDAPPLVVSFLFGLFYLTILGNFSFSILPSSKGNNDPWSYVVNADIFQESVGEEADLIQRYRSLINISVAGTAPSSVRIAYLATTFNINPIILFKPLLLFYYSLFFSSVFLLFRKLFKLSFLSALGLALVVVCNPYNGYMFLQGFIRAITGLAIVIVGISSVVFFLSASRDDQKRLNAILYLTVFSLAVIWLAYYNVMFYVLIFALPLAILSDAGSRDSTRQAVKKGALILSVFILGLFLSGAATGLTDSFQKFIINNTPDNTGGGDYLPTKPTQALGLLPYTYPFGYPDVGLFENLANVVVGLDIFAWAYLIAVLARSKYKNVALGFLFLFSLLILLWLFFWFVIVNKYMHFKNASYLSFLNVVVLFPYLFARQFHLRKRIKLLLRLQLTTLFLLVANFFIFASILSVQSRVVSGDDLKLYHRVRMLKDKKILVAIPGSWDKLWNVYFLYKYNDLDFLDATPGYLLKTKIASPSEKYDLVVYYRGSELSAKPLFSSDRYSYYAGGDVRLVRFNNGFYKLCDRGREMKCTEVLHENQ